MACESCGSVPATVHVARFENGALTSAHLCQSCAQELGESAAGAAMAMAVPEAVGRFLGEMLAGAELSMPHTGGEDRLMCSVCGTTLNDLQETGLVGCAHCYEVFAEQLTPEQREEKGAAAHTGKVPHRPAAPGPEGRELLRLRRMLDELVDSERFEEAASVRDRLNELEEHPQRS